MNATTNSKLIKGATGHSGLNDLGRHLNRRGEPVKSGLTFCASDMTIAQSVHTASRLCRVSISQTETKSGSVESQLLHPGFNESCQGSTGVHCAASTNSAKAGASRLVAVSATSHLRGDHLAARLAGW
jgi:hypothetical protein